jgi:prepilin-type processing-associated H-X9-DG protein/prepilin-type N-terminal cleavage/methylation domain-containing protein
MTDYRRPIQSRCAEPAGRSSRAGAGGLLPAFTPAFTLVELLVVIGIIAVLIAILLPSLATARRAAQKTVCAAKLQQIMVAAQGHVANHRGYYPLAGVVPGIQPPDFNDPDAVRYDYFSYPYPLGQLTLTRMLAPITVSLSTEMSYRNAILAPDANSIGVIETDDRGFIKHFVCPSQATSVSEIQQAPMLYCGPVPNDPGGDIVSYYEAMSYIFNEAVLGWSATPTQEYGRLEGHASSVRQSSKTMFAADGLAGYLLNSHTPDNPVDLYSGAYYGFGTVYNLTPNPPVTLADALLGDALAGDPQNFDPLRHRGKMNIAFCDGHVETRNVTPADLSSVFLLAP